MRTWRAFAAFSHPARAPAPLHRLRLYRAFGLWRARVRSSPIVPFGQLIQLQLLRGFQAIVLAAATSMVANDKCSETLMTLLYRPGVNQKALQRALRSRRAPAIAMGALPLRWAFSVAVARWSAWTSSSRDLARTIALSTALAMFATLRRGFLHWNALTAHCNAAHARPPIQLPAASQRQAVFKRRLINAWMRWNLCVQVTRGVAARVRMRVAFERVALCAAKSMMRSDECSTTLMTLLYRPGVDLEGLQESLRARSSRREHLGISPQPHSTAESG